MDLQEFKTQYFLFDPVPFGRIFAFVDFGNVRPWAKELWPEENKQEFLIEIDIAKIAELCAWVNVNKKYFYYGYFVEDFRSAHSVFIINKARKNGFKVETKKIKMIPNYDENGKFIGKFPKCNFDVEMTMDLLLQVEEYDTIVLFSGDSDFAKLLKYLKSLGKKVIIICTQSRISTELEGVADKFILAESLASFLRYNRKNNTPPVRAEV